MNSLGSLPRATAKSIVASFEAFAPGFARLGGSPLYAEFCFKVPKDPEIVEIVSHGLASFPALQLFAAVHYILMRDPSDPLARYFADLTDDPAPPTEAFPELARFCRRHRDELVQIISTRTVQLTTADRCKGLLAPLSVVADKVGEPLDLIEIGCSAGVLLTFDQYAYDVKGQGLIGRKDAPLTLDVDISGAPELHIPKIGKRIGLDLCPVDVRLEDERRWILAQCFPERREWRTQLAAALDVVARTDISFFEGDALNLLPDLIAKSRGPLCVFHSACVIYWSDEQKAKLDALLREASREREFYRVGMEPDPDGSKESFEIIITRYRNGEAQDRLAAEASSEFTIRWFD